MNKIIVNKCGRGTLRKEASVRFVSETSERGSEARLIGGDSYGK